MTSLLPEIKAVGSGYTFSVDPAIHNEYGLTYPVTYEFSIPSGSSGLAAYVRFSLSESWVRITEETSSNFFNGIQAVRFDYPNKMAYVSVSFASYSNSIYVYIADSSGNQINTNYLGIAPYYDNRRVTVVFSVDDLGCDPPWGATDFSSCTAAFANAKVVWTGACETFGLGYYGDWPQVQAALNTGYFEADSHSRTHPMDVPYVPDSADPYCEGYVAEIGGSKADMLGNLTLPYPYSNGGQGYVWGWIEPNGVVDNTVQQTLAQYGYLCSRDTGQTMGTVPYPSWNPTFGIYNIATTSRYMDGDTLQDLNSVFDSVYASGGIYHVWGHIGQNDWTPGGIGYQHVQYIAGKLDAWYVGFGALYVYAYTRDHQSKLCRLLSAQPPQEWMLDNHKHSPVLFQAATHLTLISGTLMEAKFLALKQLGISPHASGGSL